MSVSTEIGLMDFPQEVESLWPELMRAVEGVLRGGEFIMGGNVRAFEREVAGRLGVKHAIAMNSGTDAIMIGLAALGVGPGDEVITTPFTFVAAAEAICRVGAVPVFADIDERAFNIDVDRVRERVTGRTRAIVPVHMFGQPADMHGLMRVAEDHGLKVLDDCAHAFGAAIRGRPVGSLGHAGAFSCYPTKPLGAYGDGGFLTTDDERVAESARMLRVHGARVRYNHESIGYNSRLDELQAAVLRVKLPHVDAWTRMRRAVARRFAEGLPGDRAKIVPPAEEPGTDHVYHQYTVRIPGGARDAVLAGLVDAGIPARVFYRRVIPDLPPYRSYSAPLPRARLAAGEVISLPIHPFLRPEQVEFICGRLARLLGE